MSRFQKFTLGLLVLIHPLLSCQSDDEVEEIPKTYATTTVAGDGIWGYADGSVSIAQFSFPNDLYIDASGDICVTDAGNFRIRKISNEEMVSTFAGSSSVGYENGIGENAQFTSLVAITGNDAGDLFVGDGSRIRKINHDGLVTTLAGGVFGHVDGVGSKAQFTFITNLEIDANGNLFVLEVDVYACYIRKVTPDGVVSTYYTGNLLDGIALDSNGNIFASESGFGQSRIVKISTSKKVTEIATTPPVGNITVDKSTGDIFFSGFSPDRASTVKIYKLLKDGSYRAIAGAEAGFSDGIGDQSQI